MITTRQLLILTLLAKFYTLTASQIRRLIFGPDTDKEGRITRRLLSVLFHGKLINKTHMEVTNPLYPVTASVYYPSREGCAVLAAMTAEPKWLLTPTQTPAWQNLRHWTLLSELRMTAEAALKAQTAVEMPAWFNEFDVVNPEAKLPSDRYRLYTVVPGPRKIVAVPDAAFLLRMAGRSRAYYVELETGSNPAKTAAEKTPGYAGLGPLHKRHFADATDGFRVLMFAMQTTHRDLLRKIFRAKEGANLWRFVAMPDVRPESFLHQPIFYPAEDGPAVPLVKGGGT